MVLRHWRSITPRHALVSFRAKVGMSLFVNTHDLAAFKHFSPYLYAGPVMFDVQRRIKEQSVVFRYGCESSPISPGGMRDRRKECDEKQDNPVHAWDPSSFSARVPRYLPLQQFRPRSEYQLRPP